MNRFGFHALLWLGWLGFAALAGAQSAQLTAAELTAKADQMGQQTFTRKNGQVLTFQQIDAMPSQQSDAVIEEMTEQESEVMAKWVLQRLAAANALEAEAQKLREATEARVIEKNKMLAATEAGADEAKKLRVAAEANVVQEIEKFADTMRNVIAIGKKFEPSTKADIESDLKRKYIIDGLKPETLSFLKSLLARPELFDDK